MAKIPEKVYERLATAKMFYGASLMFPEPTNPAAQILNEVDENSYILRVIVKPKVKEIFYRTGDELKKLRELCIYGDSNETNNVQELFSFGWHTDDFSRGLEQKIKWLELWLPYYENPDLLLKAATK